MARTIRRRRPRRTRKPLATKRYVKNIVGRNSELKHHIAYTASGDYVNMDDTATIASLTGVSQGTTDITRVGDSITPKAIHFRYFLKTQATSRQRARLILFKWKPSDATTPTASDILDNDATPYNLTSHYNHDKRSQYNILYDKTFNLYYSNGSFPAGHIRLFSKKLGKKIQYIAGGTNGMGKIYVLYVNDTDTASSPVQIQFLSHLEYIDS